MFLHNVPLICTSLLNSFHEFCNPTVIKEGLIDHHIPISFALCYSWNVSCTGEDLKGRSSMASNKVQEAKGYCLSVGGRSV